MITVTAQAAEQIRIAAGQAGAEGEGLRLAARLDDKGAIEYGLGFDAAGEEDVRFQSGDVTILVSAACVELLTGATLDFVEINPGEKRFIFINPNDPAHQPPRP